MKRYAVPAVLIFMTLVLVQPVFSKSTRDIEALKEDIQALKEGLKASQQDLQEIKKLLRARRALAKFKEVVINIQGAPSKGDKNAKLALIEFSDYQ